MKAVLCHVAAIAVLMCGGASIAHAKPKEQAQQPQGEPLSQQRLNWLVERDRPRDQMVGSSMDTKTYKQYFKDVDRHVILMNKAVADYRQTRSVKAWRAILDSINRGGGLRDDMRGVGGLRLAFKTLHEMGPPVDDPENAGDAPFAARRHHAMMRLLARDFWPSRFATDADKRIAAFYLKDCERRPSPLRPTGNNHDPNCGFIFEMNYVHDNRKVQRLALYMPDADPVNFWDDDSVPQSFADFAANVPSQRPQPNIYTFQDYPLLLNRPQKTVYEPWAGNEYGFIVIYNRPYIASRAYQQERYIASKKATRAALDELARKSEEDRIRRKKQENAAGERWDELWAKASLSSDLQLELENIADGLNRLDLYRTRYQIISYYRIAGYCQMGYQTECYRKIRMDDDARAQQMANQWGGGGGGGGSSGGSQVVTVRNYDRNGNYTGSTVTTRIDATLSGAKPY